MKRFIFLSLFISTIVFCHSPLKQEAEMHYHMAIDRYKNKDYKEAARLLNEVVSYYDMEHIKSWELLIKVYKKLSDKEKLKETKKMFENIKRIIKFRKQRKLEDLNPYEALIYGTIEQKISSCRLFAENKDKKAIPYLIDCLVDPFYNYYLDKYEIREIAADTLSKYGEEIVPILTERFKLTKDKTLKWWLLETIFRIYKDKKPQDNVVNIFISGLDDISKNIKIVSLKALTTWKITEPIKIRLPNLLAPKEDNKVRYWTLNSIKELEIYEDAKNEIIKILNEKDKMLVDKAITTLLKLSKKEEVIKKDITDTLIKIAEDKTRPVSTRYYAIKALGNILKPDDIKKIKGLLEDENFWIRAAVASVLYHELYSMSKEEIELRKEILDETAIKFSIESEKIYEEARLASIDKALKFLESIQKEDGSLPSFFPLGTTLLATLCFLNQGYNEEYPFIKKAIEFILKWRQSDGSFYCHLDEKGAKKPVYPTALTIMVLSRTYNPKYKDIIKSAVDWIKDIQNPDGGFGYYKGSRSDITATKFALLGLNDGYEYLGLKKIDDVFLRALEYLKDLQNPDGGFGYTKEFKKHSYGSATADGLISLFLASADKKIIKKTLRWIEKNYTWDENPFGDRKYYEYFIWAKSNALNLTKKDVIKDKHGKPRLWYNEVLRKLLSEQNKDGSWVTDKEPLFTTYFISVLQLKKIKDFLSGL